MRRLLLLAAGLTMLGSPAASDSPAPRPTVLASTMVLRFSQLIQDSQAYGSDDEHMVSRVFLDVVFAGKTTSCHADVRLAAGGDYLTDPLEVGPPAEYRGPIDSAKFSDAVIEYVRRTVGPAAREIRLAPAIRGIRMRNNSFRSPWEVSFAVTEAPPAR
jgi:hypothetical protein